MTQPRSQRPDRPETGPPWLFAWRAQAPSLWVRLLPTALATLGFAGLLVGIRVELTPPRFELGGEASWLQLPATEEGREWALRALEGGPHLTRYDPESWSGYAAMADAVTSASRIQSSTYHPDLRPLPSAPPPTPPAMAASGQTVFPRRQAQAPPTDAPAEARLCPVLRALSPLGSATLPTKLPPFIGDIDATMAAAEWNFLLRLQPNGGVTDCVALTKPADLPAARLEAWLRGVTFDPKLAAGGGWLAVGIGFNLLPSHDPDAR